MNKSKTNTLYYTSCVLLRLMGFVVGWVHKYIIYTWLPLAKMQGASISACPTLNREQQEKNNAEGLNMDSTRGRKVGQVALLMDTVIDQID